MIIDEVQSLPVTAIEADPILIALAAEVAALSAATTQWRARMPAGTAGRRTTRWAAEGRVLLQRRERLEILARSYGLIETGR